MRKLFTVEGMSCAACSSSVERVVSKLKGVTKAEVSLTAKTLICEFDESLIGEKDVIKAVKRAGFSAALKSSDVVKTERNSGDGFTPVKIRLIVSCVFLVILMYISMGHMLSPPITDRFNSHTKPLLFAFTQLLLTLPVIYVNRKFYFSGIKALIHRAANMDSLVALGSAASLIYGIFSIYMIGYYLEIGNIEATYSYSSNLYFESAAMILTLVTLGKFLEARASRKTTAAVDKLKKLVPDAVTVERGDEEISLPASEVRPGDIVVVRQGEHIPVDGVVCEGSSSVDASAITGESLPRDVLPGDGVLSASVNLDGFLKIKATRAASESTLSKIISIVEEAGATKAPAARLADKISGIFVPAVIAIALVTFAAWVVFGFGVSFALECSISVLVVSCPCALGLATPVAISVAIGRAASRGVLIKNAAAFDQLAKTDCVVFDKTGTVTEGVLSVTDSVSLGDGDKNEFILTLASLESRSSHPIASAIKSLVDGAALPECSDFRSVLGRGAEGVVGGRKVAAGNLEFMRENRISTEPLDEFADRAEGEGKSVVYVAADGKIWGIVALSDAVRADAPDAVKRIKESGRRTVLLTGDSQARALAVGGEIGFDEIIFGVLPEEKASEISKLKENGRCVLMVGDGINDSPALALADTSIAMGGGTDIAMDSSDIVLLSDDVGAIADMLIYSKKVRRNIAENLLWAFLYNTLGIPIAAGLLYIPLGILLSPMLASLAMSLSSVFVVTNALRLYRKM